ncbi:MAG: MTH895/ArsE family thioredoxin-like protein [Candidatus Hodarchaeota archaeon]
MSIKIQVFGPGCMNCINLENNVKNVLKKLSLETKVEVEKVTDRTQFIDAGVVRTPALGIDGKIVTQGKITSEEEIEDLLKPFLKD